MASLIYNLRLFVIAILLIIITCLMSCSKKTNGDELFIPVTTQFLKDKLESGESINALYSEELCGSCASIKEKIKTLSQNKDVEVYYLDAENTTDLEFLKINHIITTPSLLIIRNHIVTVIAGDVSSEEISVAFGWVE